MNASTPVDKSSALWIEWLKFKNSEEYANIWRWPNNIEGNLWCAFESGFRSAASGSPPSPFPDGSYEIPLERRLDAATLEFSHPRLGISATNKHTMPITTEEAKELLALLRASSGSTGGAPTDTRRLDWMEANGVGVSRIPLGETQWDCWWNQERHSAPTIREALDAAMGAAARDTGRKP